MSCHVPHKDMNVVQMNLPLLYTSKAESEDYHHDPSSQCGNQPGWRLICLAFFTLTGLLYSLIYPYTPRWCLYVVEQRLRGTFPSGRFTCYIDFQVSKPGIRRCLGLRFGEKLQSAVGTCCKVILTQLNPFSFTFFYKLPFTFFPLAVTSECREERQEEKRAGMVYLILSSAPRCAVRAEGEQQRSNLSRASPFLWWSRGEVSSKHAFYRVPLWERIHFCSFGIYFRAWSYKNRSPPLYFFSSSYVLVCVKCYPELNRWSWVDHILGSVYEGVSDTTKGPKNREKGPRQQVINNTSLHFINSDATRQLHEFNILQQTDWIKRTSWGCQNKRFRNFNQLYYINRLNVFLRKTAFQFSHFHINMVSKNIYKFFLSSP